MGEGLDPRAGGVCRRRAQIHNPLPTLRVPNDVLRSIPPPMRLVLQVDRPLPVNSVRGHGHGARAVRAGGDLVTLGRVCLLVEVDTCRHPAGRCSAAVVVQLDQVRVLAVERLQPEVWLAPAYPIVRLSVEKAAASRPAVRVAETGAGGAARLRCAVAV